MSASLAKRMYAQPSATKNKNTNALAAVEKADVAGCAPRMYEWRSAT
jgi:hypothetical protein